MSLHDTQATVNAVAVPDDGQHYGANTHDVAAGTGIATRVVRITAVGGDCFLREGSGHSFVAASGTQDFDWFLIPSGETVFVRLKPKLDYRFHVIGTAYWYELQA